MPRVTIVGSADAFNSAGRAHSCYLLEAKGAGQVMVDFGATALSRLKQLPREPNALDGILITHLHGDHVGGIPFLLIDAMFRARRTRPLHVLGPLGTREALDAMFRVTYGPVADYDRSFDFEIEEMAPDQGRDWLGWSIESFPADHMDPPEAPLCLRLQANGRSVAFSGDTSMCDGLWRAIEGVDLAIVECTGLQHPIGRHCAWTDWEAAFPRLSARRLLMTHLGDEVRAAAAEGRISAPGVDFAEDGMVIEL
ncbi:MAG: MBL fold metallo-hydrolase [Myxococcota bacterium]